MVSIYLGPNKNMIRSKIYAGVCMWFRIGINVRIITQYHPVFTHSNFHTSTHTPTARAYTLSSGWLARYDALVWVPQPPHMGVPQMPQSEHRRRPHQFAFEYHGVWTVRHRPTVLLCRAASPCEKPVLSHSTLYTRSTYADGSLAHAPYTLSVI